jgi:hypothetical protein
VVAAPVRASSFRLRAARARRTRRETNVDKGRVYWIVRVTPIEVASREEAQQVAAAIVGAVPEAEVTIGECEEYKYVPAAERKTC